MGQSRAAGVLLRRLVPRWHDTQVEPLASVRKNLTPLSSAIRIYDGLRISWKRSEQVLQVS
jgi:hypothetical protein